MGIEILLKKLVEMGKDPQEVYLWESLLPILTVDEKEVLKTSFSKELELLIDSTE